jgi:hypothetical protein
MSQLLKLEAAAFDRFMSSVAQPQPEACFAVHN